MPTTNHQVRLAARPQGLPTADVWEHTTEELGDPGPGQFMVKVSYLSLDPAMRGWMNEGKSYIPPVGIGEVMRAGAIGEVIASEHDEFAVGDHVSYAFGVQEYALCDGEGADTVDPGKAPLPTYLGALGMTGMTAYFGLLDEGRPKEGETVVVSGAAGAVGSVVGQIAKLKGCRVVGIAGGAEKCAWLTDELGFDAAIDYKSEDVGKALRAAAPEGRRRLLRQRRRRDPRHRRSPSSAAAPASSSAARSRSTTPPRASPGPKNYLSLLVNRASMQGMVVFDYADRYGEAAKEMAGWLGQGKLVSREEVVEGGVEDFPETLLRLFRGENTGKLVLQLT